MGPQDEPCDIAEVERQRRADNAERRLTNAERTAAALEMRIAGETYPAIAERLGYANKSNAYRVVKRALDAITREPAEHLLALEIERLDGMFRVAWSFVLNDGLSADERMRAIDRAIKIQERRARYQGLDQPVRLDIAGMVAQVAAEFELPDDERAALFNDVQRALAAAALEQGDGR